jgi:cytochrome P450
MEAIDDSLRNYVFLKSFPILRKLLYSLPAGIQSPAQATLISYETAVAHHVADRITKASQEQSVGSEIPSHTMLRFLVPPSSTATAPPHNLSTQNLIEELQIFILGGGETVANTMVQGFSGILQQPTLYNDLYTEISQIWPDVNAPVPAVEALEKLPLLTASIKESLRLSHGVTAPMPRIVSSNGACIDGHIVPGGTCVGVSHLFVHLSPDLFRDPDQFEPRRWVKSSGTVKSNLDKYMIAFSKGPRSCIGINLAWCEPYLMFATLIRLLRMEFPADINDPRPKWKDFFQPLYYGKPLRVRCVRLNQD